MEVIVNGNARTATMGGSVGTRLDALSFTDWGGLPHMIGTDGAGNILVAAPPCEPEPGGHRATIRARDSKGDAAVACRTYGSGGQADTARLIA
jgi:hypothetical protein